MWYRNCFLLFFSFDSRSSNLVAHKMAASAGARAKSSSTSTVDEAVAFAK